MIYALIVFVSMGLGDIGSTAKIKFVEDGHRIRACLAEAWSDLATLGSIGIGAVQIFHSGFITSVTIVISLACGSIIGTYLGQKLAEHWDINGKEKNGQIKSYPISIRLDSKAFTNKSLQQRATPSSGSVGSDMDGS